MHELRKIPTATWTGVEGFKEIRVGKLEISLGKLSGKVEETFLCSLKWADFEEIHQKQKTKAS